ncbi:unnamed protein product [Thlaspi arvense]|uniref:USP domain-containing protein n=1 Tax=Thlaspi arvense TaxID=13288 RepID=A0AAU9RUC2_THLAR|nr:unnamed protein product [Thlaspi arvense]
MRCVTRMKTKREEDNGEEQEYAKRQKLLEQPSSPSPSPPRLGFDNALLPLASYADDEDEEEDDGTRGARVGNGGGRIEQNGGKDAGRYDDEDDDDNELDKGPSQGKRNREIEVRKDCPYLDTVNRQRGFIAFQMDMKLMIHHWMTYDMFTREQVEELDRNKQWSRALDGSDYLPGMVGLNNIKETDFVNVTIQSLMRVTPLRNFFLIPENYQHSKSPLVHRFGELTRKIWHARNFKGQVSPHEFLQAVMKASKKRFRIGHSLTQLNLCHGFLIHYMQILEVQKEVAALFTSGELEVVKEIHSRPFFEKKENGDEQNNGSVGDGGIEQDNVVTETSRMLFLMLGLDLPPPPLFKDVMEKNIIPQVPLFNILKKFDGELVTEVVRPRIARMRYRVTRLPQYLILHMRRFTKNNFFVEKNPTLVNFPVKNLELKDYIPLPTPKENEKLRSKYDLIANIVHDGKPGEGSYRVFCAAEVRRALDLHVSETLPQMVALSEAYMQIYEQQQ